MQRDADASIYFEVRVYSERRPELCKLGIVEHGQHTAAKERQLVGGLAGAMAELLCAEQHDTIEPSAAARAAMEVYDELVAEQPVLQRGNEIPRYADRDYLRLARN